MRRIVLAGSLAMACAAAAVVSVSPRPATAVESPASLRPPLRALEFLVDRYGGLLVDLNEGDGLAGESIYASLLELQDLARDSFEGCDVVKLTQATRTTLATFDPELGRGQFEPTVVYSALSELHAALLNLELAVLSSVPTAECGGVSTTPQVVDQQRVKVLRQGIKGFDVRVDFPIGSFSSAPFEAMDPQELGQRAVQLATLYVGFTGQWSPAIGAPALPMVELPFGLPARASFTTSVLESDVISMESVFVAPKQEQPADGDDRDPFSTPPFEFDRESYATSKAVPAALASSRRLGDARSLDLGTARLAAARFTPSSRRLDVVRSITVRVAFRSKDDTPRFPSIGGVWDTYGNTMVSSLVNSTSVLDPGLSVPPGAFRPLGEEFLIVTSSALSAQAEDYADFARLRGLVTRVVTYGDPGVGTTAEELQTFIRARLNGATGVLRPSYLLLFGDTDQIPTFQVATPWSYTDFDGLIGTDRPYALRSAFDTVPDMAVGRFPVSTVDEATAMVAKMRRYVNSPPSDSTYYTSATVTSYFQSEVAEDQTGVKDKRGFTKLADTVASHLESVGKTVERLNTANDNDDPTTFYDGTSIPSYLRRPTDDWEVANGTLAASIDAGRFLTMHRDHGAPTVVSHPTLSTGEFSSISNVGEPTMLWLVDCAAGKFDDPDVLSLTEVAVRDDGGAIAAIGASRNSPSFTNNHMALGMTDAVFPTLLAGYGSSKAILRIGDVMNAGKVYMATRVGGDGSDADTVAAEWDLYNLMGDPTLPILIKNPYRVRPTVARWRTTEILRILTSAHATVTVTDGRNRAVARGTANAKGVVRLEIPAKVGTKRLLISAARQDGVPSPRETVRLATRPES